MSRPKTFADYGIEIPPGQTGEVDTLCPRCSGTRAKSRHRCISVNTDSGTWLCHHCGWSGALGAGEGKWREPAPKRPTEYTIPAPLSGALTDEALAWFAGRDIAEDVVRRNGVVVEETFVPQLGEKVGAIAFPYLRRGKLVNVKYRARGKHFTMVKGAERVLYGLDDCAYGPEGYPAPRIVFVEGECDKLAVEVAGIRECMSVPDGAPPPNATNYAGKFSFLSDPFAEAILAGAREIVIATDADAPGQRLADELAGRLGKERCWRVLWPEGIKDANEALVALGADGLRRILDAAQPWPIEGVTSPSELAAELVALYRGGLPPGASTGLPSLDRGYTVKGGQLSVWTGMPGSGKSELLDQLMVNLARSAGYAFALFSPENHPPERHVVKFLEKIVGRPFGDGPSERMAEADALAFLDTLDCHFTFLTPESPTIDAILELTRQLHYRSGINGLVIDPWNELEHQRPRDLSETEYVSVTLSKLRRFARNHGLHVWIVAHPTKLLKDKEGQYPVPTPYDISGSAHWFNKADNCLSIWRDKTDETAAVQVHVQKVRFREVGRLGMAEVAYDRITGRYADLGIWHDGARPGA